jgi:hypothetical protein
MDRAKPSTDSTKPSGGGTTPPEDPNKQAWKTKKNHNRRKKKGADGRTSDETSAPRSAFSGRCEDLEGSIYGIGPNQTDRYIKMTREIEEYLGRKFTPEATKSIEELTLVTFTEPTKPVDAAGTAVAGDTLTYVQKTILSGPIKEYLYETKKFEQDMAKIYSTIHGQRTDAMVHKLTTDQDYKAVKDSSNPIGLLKLIKKICYSYQTEQFQVLSMIRAVKQVFSITQGHKETNIDYLERFKNRITVAMSCGAEFLFPGVLDFISVETYHMKYQALTNPVELADIQTLTQEVVKATIYLDSANKGRYYGNLMKDLENDYLKDRDNFPRDIVGTQKLLLNYKRAEAIAPNRAQSSNDVRDDRN